MQTVCLGVNLKHKPLARVAIIEKSHLITEAGLTVETMVHSPAQVWPLPPSP